MIVSQLTGGLGNQMFQYATGFALARRTAQRFRLDLSHYEHVDPSLPNRPFALDRLRISSGPVVGVDRIAVEVANGDRRLRAQFFRRLSIHRLNVLVDRAEGADERLKQVREPTQLVGCWQTEESFVDARDALVEEFAFRRPPNERNARLIDDMRSSVAVAVHFRRTDYLHAGTLTRPCSLDYYARAFAAMQASVPDATYYVFTDDPTWVAANATLPERHVLVSHNVGVDDAEDLRLMTHCDHFIIANSSFSWWGAWLARGEDKQVIAPAVWFEQSHGSERDLVPRNWTRL